MNSRFHSPTHRSRRPPTRNPNLNRNLNPNPPCNLSASYHGSAGVSPAFWVVPRLNTRRRDAGAPSAVPGEQPLSLLDQRPPRSLWAAMANALTPL